MSGSGNLPAEHASGLVDQVDQTVDGRRRGLLQPDMLGCQHFERFDVANKYRDLIRAAERDYDEGLIKGADLKRRRETLQPKIDAIESQLVGARQSSRLNGLIGRADAAARFAKLDLAKQRTIVDTLCKVTIKPTVKPGGVFDADLIDVDWR
jgi:hypothetical protein